ncbi:MAG: FAD-dependent oxidoreductase [Planctomycetota bacterium]
MPNFIAEPARSTPIAWEGDLVVVGGSCTGVFAAIRAARLGMSVALVEQNVIFGGSATAAQVNEWHSLYDTSGQTPIIGGLTREVVESMRQRGATAESPNGLRDPFRFNSAELAATLDELVTGHDVRPFLSARVVAGSRVDDRIEAVVLEDKSGRRALRARVFIDASGDGDLLRRCGFSAWRAEALQPVTLQALVGGLSTLRETYPEADFWKDVCDSASSYGLPPINAKPWISPFPGAPGISNLYGPRMGGVDASDADQHTAAMLQGRSYIRAYLAMARDRYPEAVFNVVAWSQALGVRETWHAKCHSRITGNSLLAGKTYEDAIAFGTYPIDIHHEGGTTLRWLDGTQQRIDPNGTSSRGRWRDAIETPGYYAVPYRSLVPERAENLLVAGRLIDADRDAFGAVRVMVNTNQTGEAVGVAAALAVRDGRPVADVDPTKLQNTLADGGSILPPPPASISKIPAVSIESKPQSIPRMSGSSASSD